MNLRCEPCPVRNGSICEALSDASLRQLAKLSRQRHFKAQQKIFNIGDDVEYFFNIISGIVKLQKLLMDGEQHIIGLFYPGDFIGHTARDRHIYSAEAATEVEICCYPRAPFRAFLASHPMLERKLYDLTVRKLDICRDWTLLLGHKSSYERVASFLFMLVRSASKPGHGDRASDYVELQLPLARSEIADYLGLTVETVCRQLARLKDKGIVKLQSSRDVIVPSVELLAATAAIDTCLEDFDSLDMRIEYAFR